MNKRNDNLRDNNGVLMNKLIVPTPDTWNNAWSIQYNKEENEYYLESERKGLRWLETIKYLDSRLENKENLKAIEIGAGRGLISYLLSEQYGAEPSLLDFSQIALDASKELYKQLGKEGKYIFADATDLPEEQQNAYDFVSSIGLIEHFEDPTQIVDAHFKAVKDGGFVIIGVPNAWCIPYRIYKFIAEIFDKYEVGYEDPYSYFRVKKIAESRNIKDYVIVGSSHAANAGHWYMFLGRPIKKAIYKLLRMNYKEKHIYGKSLREERRSGFGQLWSSYLTIIMKVDK